MSETILKVFLSDIQRIRLVCQKKDCGGAAEMPVSKIGSGHAACPVCGFNFPDLQKILRDLSDNFRILNEREKNQDGQIEFLVEEKNAS